MLIFIGASLAGAFPLAVIGFLLWKIRRARRVQKELIAAGGTGNIEEFKRLAKSYPDEHELTDFITAVIDSLSEKTSELIFAKQQLETFTGFLTTRIEARTKELHETQEELKNARAEIAKLRESKS